MAYEFRLPDLGEGIAEAEVRNWLVKEGDRVEEHQNVVELETDKAVIEVPSPRAGFVLKILCREGETLKVGEVLLSLAEEAGPPPATPAAATEARAAVGGPPPTPATKAPSATPSTPPAAAAAVPRAETRSTASVVGQLPEAEDESPGGEILATPGVRALARERGLGLEGLRGSGPRGSITREDLLGAGSGPDRSLDQYGELRRLPQSATRKAIAKRLRTAHDAAVYVTAMAECDVTELWELRSRKAAELAEAGIRLTFMPFIIKGLALALRRHGSLNAEYDERSETLLLKSYVNVGIAVDGPEGLLVPVLKAVQDKSILQLAGELQDLAARARRRELAPSELKGSSITISNYGAFGGSFATPLPNYPDVAILGCGAVADRPWVFRGEIAVRKILPLALTFDHRVTDGGEGSRLLGELGRMLGDPAELVLESR